MKTLLWTLLLLCLCVPGHSDCQRDCLSCSQRLFQHDTFNTLVCIVECGGKGSTAITWEICRKVLGLPLWGVLGRGVVAQLPLAEEGLLYTGVLKQFTDITRAFGMDNIEGEKLVSKITGAFHREEEVDESLLEDDNAHGTPEVTNGLSKRFGGFMKGKYGYRKLMGPGRSLQKRYGGFIGIRKSARKWNNPKRYNELLKQYLGISTRSNEYGSISADISEQNEI
ncbi:prepronociceptin-like [Acipenser oxyrinchus oxyrinchus]|uniref:Prepronociceptin-like n=1 Tax=Acipenser oxyrinchus oxyrinchus TaxID=40147 RepID=A0AAD8LNK2_ACIOX|nr:prepronociceptin-like [Acipenser oxyrinchus oxyrinchus]